MNTMFAAFLGGWEWVIVLLAVLLLFGAKKIPDLAKGLGRGIKEFKKAAREVTDEIQNPRTDTTKLTSKPPKHDAAVESCVTCMSSVTSALVGAFDQII